MSKGRSRKYLCSKGVGGGRLKAQGSALWGGGSGGVSARTLFEKFLLPIVVFPLLFV